MIRWLYRRRCSVRDSARGLGQPGERLDEDAADEHQHPENDDGPDQYGRKTARTVGRLPEKEATPEAPDVRQRKHRPEHGENGEERSPLERRRKEELVLEETDGQGERG